LARIYHRIRPEEEIEMKRRYSVAALLILVLGLNACPKKSDLTQTDVQQKKLLVMVPGDPRGYVWNMVGTMGAAAAFGLLGVATDAAIVTERGKDFDEALRDYPLNLKLRSAIMAELAKTVTQPLVPVCLPGEDPASGCAFVDSPETLKSQYAGQMLLVVKPCEWGLRNDIPYIAVNTSLFEIDTQRPVWYYSHCLKNEEINVERRSLKEWKSDLPGLTACLDNQIAPIAREIAQFVQQGSAPKQEKVVWVYAGCMPPDFDKCTAPGKK
jgi:hypothetical protein